MKSSKYNIIFEHRGKSLAFNSITCYLAEVDDIFINTLDGIQSKKINEEKLETHQKQLISNMKRGGFLIEDSFDEIEFLEYSFNKNKFASSEASVTILPTSSCNCCCPYCFEGEKTNHTITNDIKEAIYKQINIITNGEKSLKITWFGGEPLLAKHHIWEMSEKMISMCEKKGISYKSGMITNGYLINNEVIDHMIKAKIKGVQITLDGTPEIHDSIRKLHSGMGTFYKIISSVEKLLERKIHVSLRIHINSMNKSDIEELLNILEGRNLKKCYVDFGYVTGYTDKCKICTPLTTQEFSEKSVLYKKMLTKMGFNKEFYLQNYPDTRNTHCTANKIDSFVVDPHGDLYTCWVQIGNANESVGNIIDVQDIREINTSCNIDYMLWSPFKHEKCRKCKALPFCMGGCINRGLLNRTPECSAWKFDLIETLKLTYDNKRKI